MLDSRGCAYARPAVAGFAIRGVIEGFYGPPWAGPDRTDFMRWMADHGFNVYVHAPKHDPWQRLRWRQPYPDSEMAQFKAEIDAARQGGLRWVPSVSPGLPHPALRPDDRDVDICFSDEVDRAVLFVKLDAFWDLG